jgi:hypothetical protein
MKNKQFDLSNDSRRLLKAFAAFMTELELFVQSHEELRAMGMDLIKKMAGLERGPSRN